MSRNPVKRLLGTIARSRFRRAFDVWLFLNGAPILIGMGTSVMAAAVAVLLSAQLIRDGHTVGGIAALLASGQHVLAFLVLCVCGDCSEDEIREW